MNEKPAGNVVIVGGGFAGLYAAKALGKRSVRVTLVDRRNHHLFQPLLYQVATAALSPADIAEPIRKILRPYASVTVIMDEVTGLDRHARQIALASGRQLPYDHLILATGATHSYFGQEHWREIAPGLKSLEDATAIRAKVLSAFERAEAALMEAEQRELLTFVVIGGGPTGVELAGSIAEIARLALVRDFRNIDPANARIILIEGTDRLLGAFDAGLGDYAHAGLQRLGVEVRLSARVEEVTWEGVSVGEFIRARTVLWAAGVAASPLGRLLDAEHDRTGRVHVAATLALPTDPAVFVLGDLAHVKGDDGNPLPGLAQVAKQQGTHLGRELADHIRSGSDIAPFRYRSRGNAAIIGRHAAVYDGRAKLRGAVAWLFWAVVHVYLLTGFQNRVMVSLQWLWRYLTAERGARLIVGRAPAAPGPGDDDDRRAP